MNAEIITKPENVKALSPRFTFGNHKKMLVAMVISWQHMTVGNLYAAQELASGSSHHASTAPIYIPNVPQLLPQKISSEGSASSRLTYSLLSEKLLLSAGELLYMLISMGVIHGRCRQSSTLSGTVTAIPIAADTNAGSPSGFTYAPKPAGASPPRIISVAIFFAPPPYMVKSSGARLQKDMNVAAQPFMVAL